MFFSDVVANHERVVVPPDTFVPIKQNKRGGGGEEPG